MKLIFDILIKIECTKCHAEIVVQQFSQLTYYINAYSLVYEIIFSFPIFILVLILKALKMQHSHF